MVERTAKLSPKQQINKIPDGEYHVRKYHDDLHIILHLWKWNGEDSYDIVVEREETKNCIFCDKKFCSPHGIEGMIKTAENCYENNPGFCKECIPKWQEMRKKYWTPVGRSSPDITNSGD